MKKKLVLSAALLWATQCMAQVIPNAGFETWAAVGPFLSPTGWATSPAVAQSSAAHTGSWALQCKVDTFTNPMSSTLDTIAATAYTGAATMGPPPLPGTSFGGFAYTAWPDSLTGYFKYSGAPTDSFTILAQLCKWDTTTHTRTIIKQVRWTSNTATSSYTRFSLPLIASGSATIPDTAFIQVFAANQQAPKHMGTSLWVDDLGFVTLPNAVASAPATKNINIYPNPFTDKITVLGLAIKNLQIRTVTGKTVLTTTENIINTAELAPGLYYLTITHTTGEITIKQIVKR
jgi:hypothetical protein